MFKNNIIIRTILLAAFFSLICILNSFGQINTNSSISDEYKKFNKTFNEEVNKQQDTGFYKSGLPYHIAPSALPNWFYNIPSPNCDTTFFIGISDPSLPSKIGLTQAIERAKGMSVLLRNTKIRYLRTVYNVDFLKKNKEEFNSKFEELYELASSENKLNYEWETVAFDSTKFGETIVLIKIFPTDTLHKKKNIADAFNIFCFNVEYQKADKFELNSKVEVIQNLINNERKVLYSWKEIGKIANIKSLIGVNEKNICGDYFKYKSSDKSFNSEKDFSPFVNLYYGLWYAYINSLLKTLQNSIQPENFLVQNVDEHYSKKFQDYSKEISIIYTSFEINEIIIQNNQIFVNLNFKQ